MAYKLTAKEEEIMERIWQIGACAPKDVQALYTEEERPHINSVSNAFQSLEKKGYLRHRQRGRGYLYEPVVSQEEYGRLKLTNFVDRYFGGSVKDLVTFFSREQKISPKELQDIINEIENTQQPQM